MFCGPNSVGESSAMQYCPAAASFLLLLRLRPLSRVPIGRDAVWREKNMETWKEMNTSNVERLPPPPRTPPSFTKVSSAGHAISRPFLIRERRTARLFWQAHIIGRIPSGSCLPLGAREIGRSRRGRETNNMRKMEDSRGLRKKMEREGKSEQTQRERENMYNRRIK